MNKIVVTGGGSGGHTIPALVMIKFWKAKGDFEIYYLGSKKGIEREVVTSFVKKYYPINTGKLRRYFSLENFIDVFKFIFGIIQSLCILFKIRPFAVFSTGGFVALPVVIAAKVLGIRVVIHEQTTHVGLANKLSSYFADAICISFKSSAQYFSIDRTLYTGYPLRPEFYAPIEKLQYFKNQNFTDSKKILLILGGGNGSVLLNSFVKNNLKSLCDNFHVILQAGKSYEHEFDQCTHEHFSVFSFLQEEMVQLLYSADYVIARAGAGTVCELMHLKKQCIFVPLAIAQKDEQWHNAQAAKEYMGSIVLHESDWKTSTPESIIKMLRNLSVRSHCLFTDKENNAAMLIHSKVVKP